MNKKQFLTIIAKGSPTQLRVEFDKDYFDSINLLKSGKSKEYQNIDISLFLLYFHDRGFDIIEILRIMMYLIAQKYPVRDLDSILKELSKKISQDFTVNQSKPTDIYSTLFNSFEKGGLNYVSLSSFFFNGIRDSYKNKFDQEDLAALDSLFNSTAEHQIDVFEQERESVSLLNKNKSKSLEDVDIETIQAILDITPLGLIASETNNLYKKASEMNLVSKNMQNSSISEKQRKKLDKIAFVELGVLIYVGYSPEIKEVIRKRVESEKFTGDIEITFINR